MEENELRYLAVYGGESKVVLDCSEPAVASLCYDLLSDPKVRKVYHCFSQLRRAMERVSSGERKSVERGRE